TVAARRARSATGPPALRPVHAPCRRARTAPSWLADLLPASPTRVPPRPLRPAAFRAPGYARRTEHATIPPIVDDQRTSVATGAIGRVAAVRSDPDRTENRRGLCRIATSRRVQFQNLR